MQRPLAKGILRRPEGDPSSAHERLALALICGLVTSLAAVQACASKGSATARESAATPNEQPRGGPNGLAEDHACPRDAARDAVRRCRCVEGRLGVLGACVPGSVADAYCGPGARMTSGGCVYRPCADDETVALGSGACVGRIGRPDGAACTGVLLPLSAGPGAPPAVCVAREATCPRGSTRRGTTCAEPPPCPPGSIFDGLACRPFVGAPRTAGLESHEIDVATWAAIALGDDGGRGSDALCRPLLQRPDLLVGLVGSLPTGDAGLPEIPLAVLLRIRVRIPDQDIAQTRVTTEVSGPKGLRLLPAAQALGGEAVETMLGPFRALAGEASTSALDLDVQCDFPRERGRLNSSP